jgi:hypothetical protein
MVPGIACLLNYKLELLRLVSSVDSCTTLYALYALYAYTLVAIYRAA